MSDPTSSLPPGCEILVLEDDTVLRRQLAAYLRTLGASVTEAGLLAEARRLLDAVRFDFALVDLHLPDGEVLQLLREGAFSENTGVVVMTAFGGVKQAVEAMRLGAGDYLAKPFEREEAPLAFLRCRSLRVAARREEHRTGEGAGESDGLFFGESLAKVADAAGHHSRRGAAPRRQPAADPDRRGDRHRQDHARPLAARARARARAGPWSPSIAPPCPKRSRNPSCSATSAGLSLTRSRRASACGRPPTAARSSSTRSRPSLRRPRARS